MANKFEGALFAIGKNFVKGLDWAAHEAVPVEQLAGLLFPQTAPEMGGVIAATQLIQNSVLLVEQKYAAANMQTGTGAQKSAEVLTLAAPAVSALLKQVQPNADPAYLQRLVDAVVAILNFKQAGPVAVEATPAAAA